MSVLLFQTACGGKGHYGSNRTSNLQLRVLPARKKAHLGKAEGKEGPKGAGHLFLFVTMSEMSNK